MKKVKKTVVKKTKRPYKKSFVGRLVDMFNSWENFDEKNPDGTRPFSKHQFIVFEPSFDFRFKWLVPREDMKLVAKYAKVKLNKDQKILVLGIGEHTIELEELPEKPKISKPN